MTVDLFSLGGGRSPTGSTLNAGHFLTQPSGFELDTYNPLPYIPSQLLLK